MTQVLCVLGNLLGNRTFSARLEESLQRLQISSRVVSFSTADYDTYPAPRLVRASGPLEVMNVFGQKWRTLRIAPPTAVLVNGWELAVVASDHFPDVPIAVALDTTPELLRDQSVLAARQLQGKLMARGAELVYSRLLRRVAARDSVWLPMSSWCRDSLVSHYGVPTHRTHVTLSPQPQLHPRTAWGRQGPLRAIFVGNDFRRKGGSLLAEILRATSAEELHLEVVSNDPAARELLGGTRAELIQGISDPALIVDRYRRADILLFPTRRDQFGHVVAEAMACGAVPVVTDVGGVSDLVQHDVTGMVLSLDADVDAWLGAIRALSSDRARLERLSRATFDFAARRLSLERFDQTMRQVMQSLTPVASTRLLPVQ